MAKKPVDATVPNDKALATTTPESGYEKPKTLRQLEQIVESNALLGAGLWRKAADALLTIKETKVWKRAVDADGNGYPSFVVYAEERFGFKKTYAYDLVKAATRKPDAITEGGARAEMRAERTAQALNAGQAAERMQGAWTKFEHRAGDLRDRAIEDAAFVGDYDKVLRLMGSAFSEFVTKHTPIIGAALVSLGLDDAEG